ncbi:MAG: FUSC family protein, partial [Microcystis sp.]
MFISILLHWHRGYWIALTVLFVLQPDYGGTMQKVIQRLGGTILGVILATPLVLQIQDINLLIIIIIILAALTAAFRFVNYAFFMLFLTMLIVLILDLDVPKDWQLYFARLQLA